MTVISVRFVLDAERYTSGAPTTTILPSGWTVRPRSATELSMAPNVIDPFVPKLLSADPSALKRAILNELTLPELLPPATRILLP